MTRSWVGMKGLSCPSVLLCLLIVCSLTALAAAFAESRPPSAVAGQVGGSDLQAPVIDALGQTAPRVPIGSATTPGDATSVFRITRPGVYYLTEDVTGVAGMSGIEVAADDVVIDLSGFALIGVTGSLDGIRVRPTRATFTVRNGTIRDWGAIGVDARDATASQIVDLVALRNGNAGFAIGTGGALLNSSSQGSPADAPALFPPLLCKDDECGVLQHHSFLLSLPIISSITNETTLFDSIPNAFSVSKFNRETNGLWRWDGACSPFPEPGCSSACFCVNPGDGFYVTVTAPSSFTIAGIDGSTTLPLKAPGAGSLSGKNLISLPYCSPIATASQLINSIGLASVADVSRYLCATDTLQVYTGRKSSGPDFPLVPSEAYYVTMISDTNYLTQSSAGCPVSGCPCGPDGTACNDDNPCTLADTCQGGTCTGTPVDCEDGNPCTDNYCIPTGGGSCAVIPHDGLACTDGDVCTVNDLCLGGNCVGGGPLSCDDSNPCTDDACVSPTGCVYTPDDGNACTDNDPCTIDSCVGGVCTETLPPHVVSGHVTCDNQFAIYTAASEVDPVTVNDQGISACHPAAPLVSFTTNDRYLYISAWSDDGNAQGLLHDLSVDSQAVYSGNSRWSVTYTDTDYDPTTGCPGPPAAMATTMEATIPPPTDWVAPAVGCANPAPGAANCLGVWGNFSAIDLSARRTWYDSGLAPSPSPPSPFSPGYNHKEFLIFRLDMCNACGPDGSSCDDGDACTTGDICSGGVCVTGTPVSCDDANPCTNDACNIETGACTHTNNTSPCDDGDACTQTDTCQSGICTGANPVVCTALDQCHDAGVCNPGTGVCTNPNKADGTACNDDNPCTLADTCQGGTCTGTLVDCEDGNPCTDNYCIPEGGGSCASIPHDGLACDDGDICTVNDACLGGNCVGGGQVSCDDGNSCTTDSCNAALGCVHVPVADGTSCNDANACTYNDVCTGGTCEGTAFTSVFSGAVFVAKANLVGAEPDANATISWTTMQMLDAVRGDLMLLRSGATYTGTVQACLADNLTATSIFEPSFPSGAFYYLMRPVLPPGCLPLGIYSSGSPKEHSGRDLQINASENACP